LNTIACSHISHAAEPKGVRLTLLLEQTPKRPDNLTGFV
jgi:hypothetical protein